MQPILIITHNQFGYQTDYYKFSHYLGSEYNVTYLCFDFGYEKIQNNQLTVEYIKKYKSRLLSLINLQYHIYKHLKKEYSLIFIKYLPFIFWITFFNKKKIVLDIRTGPVNRNNTLRFTLTSLLKFEALFFKNITVISESLLKYLGIKASKCHVLPLGADIIFTEPKDYSSFKLLYVGTFNSRNLSLTLKGLKQFLDISNFKDIHYYVIGKGNKAEEELLFNMTKTLGLNEYVTFLGYKPHDELRSYFETCNIGISFIPITKYYNIQPPTKTFEYIAAGLYVIATSTYENCRIINDSNGILINDTVEGFSSALTQLLLSKEIDQKMIQSSIKEYTWDKIVKYNLIPYFKSILNNN
jgi:glycosyltransferase involved in cell wall biosynthesis